MCGAAVTQLQPMSALYICIACNAFIAAYKQRLLSQLTYNPLLLALLLLLLLSLITIAAAVTQQHVRKLKSMFDSIDLGGSGSIDCQEFLDHIDVPRSPFTDVVFKMVGLDPKGSVSFSPLLCMVAEYCMFTRDEILRCECLNDNSLAATATATATATASLVQQQADPVRSGMRRGVLTHSNQLLSNAIDEDEFLELIRTVNNAAPLFPGNFTRALEEFDVNND
eukprot:17826-Heterococcus_DN1.PRE.1